MKKVDYRNQALKLLPWVCGKCGRDFSGKNLRELTVHHKDHNYKNNPPDGSNWELLCIYCHDNEHARSLDAEWLPTENPDRGTGPTIAQSPFAKLAHLLEANRSKTEHGNAQSAPTSGGDGIETGPEGGARKSP